MRNRPILPNWLQKKAGAVLAGIGLFLPINALAGGPPPLIIVQPLSQTVQVLGIANFSVTASSGTKMSFQWYKDGVAILGATASSYLILSVLDLDAGNYCVRVTNSGGWVMSDNATLNVVAPPDIITQPQSVAVVQNKNVSLSVIASGTGPLGYQWFFNGVSMGTLGTNSTIAFKTIKVAQAGNYYVVVTNFLGTVTSTVATLTVLVPPSISTQPQDQTRVIGQDASFSVVASGTAPLSYQWHFNGTALPGVTNSVLSLTNVQPAQAGGYSVVVTNLAGTVSSTVANLTVTPPSVFLSTPPTTATIPGGFTFQFSTPPGVTYVIWASTDLQTWSAIATNIATSDTVVFTDSSSTNFPQRFYRAVAQ